MNWVFKELIIVGITATALFLSAAEACAQNFLIKTISIDVRKQPLAEVLKTVGESGKFSFSYNSDIIPEDSLVTFFASATPVKQILNTLLGENYQYREKGNYIIILKAPKEKSRLVTGRILDGTTNQPADYVSVYSRQLLVSALSADDGNFRIRLKDSTFPLILTVSKVGYGDTTIVVQANNAADLQIRILPKAIDLDPLIVRYSAGDRTWLGRLFVSGRLRAQSNNIGQFFVSLPYQASLTPGLGTHGKMSSQVINKFSLNLLGGYTAGVNGLELAGGFNISKKDVRYAQIAGMFNVVSGNVRGVQVSGFLNHVLDSLNGVQVSGVSGTVRKNFEGVQVSGFIGMTLDHFQGVQVSGVLGFGSGAGRGVQISGALNNVSNSFSGVQVAGAVNRVTGKFKGVQISGLANIGAQQVSGLQLSTINYAKKLTGTQLGVINIADSSSGYSIGLINIIKNSPSNISIYSNEIAAFNLAWKTGNHKFYSILIGGASAGPMNKVYTFGFGFGKEFKISKSLGLSAELMNQNVFLGTWEDNPLLFRLQTAVNIKLNKRLTLFAGPAFSIFRAGGNEQMSGYKQFPMRNYPIFNQSKTYASWLGWQGGMSWRYGKI